MTSGWGSMTSHQGLRFADDRDFVEGFDWGCSGIGSFGAPFCVFSVGAAGVNTGWAVRESRIFSTARF